MFLGTSCLHWVCNMYLVCALLFLLLDTSNTFSVFVYTKKKKGFFWFLYIFILDSSALFLRYCDMCVLFYVVFISSSFWAFSCFPTLSWLYNFATPIMHYGGWYDLLENNIKLNGERNG